MPWALVLLDRVVGTRRLADDVAELVFESLFTPAMVLSGILALALKGLPRVQALAASVLMIVVWWFSWIE